ncbi:hypothetical protein DID88_009500 [Monilinia fructigena]|uniref:Uncharacterized protein n=1 Tax=Monilinia fructigena TaxID=38457 RepID=A0A395IM58_9HELO|nr:hypothetical protein DID88_009500 [Monilinia fructigena]
MPPQTRTRPSKSNTHPSKAPKSTDPQISNKNMNRAAELQKCQRQLRAAADKKCKGLLVSGKEPVLMIRKNAGANARAKYGGCLVM